jgi:hypothetical protein
MKRLVAVAVVGALGLVFQPGSLRAGPGGAAATGPATRDRGLFLNILPAGLIDSVENADTR